MLVHNTHSVKKKFSLEKKKYKIKLSLFKIIISYISDKNKTLKRLYYAKILCCKKNLFLDRVTKYYQKIISNT